MRISRRVPQRRCYCLGSVNNDCSSVQNYQINERKKADIIFFFRKGYTVAEPLVYESFKYYKRNLALTYAIYQTFYVKRQR